MKTGYSDFLLKFVAHFTDITSKTKVTPIHFCHATDCTNEQHISWQVLPRLWSSVCTSVRLSIRVNTIKQPSVTVASCWWHLVPNFVYSTWLLLLQTRTTTLLLFHRLL